jgi:lysophospholipase L1-like esterase
MRASPTLALFVGASLLLAGAAPAEVIDALDSPSFKFSNPKGRAELVEGRKGKALRLEFPENGKSVFAMRPARAAPEWDQAAGFSFWVKGNGSKGFGGLQWIWGDDFSLRYDYAFPIEGDEWRKITVAWRDLIPVLPSPRAKPIDAAVGNAPSKLTQIWFGKWWYWREAGAEAFAIDDLRLEPAIAVETAEHRPAGAPLARVAARLKHGQPITVVTMGDSLTDATHWTNRKTNWPARLRAQLKERFGSDVTIVNPAIGGTQLRQNLVLLPLWTKDLPEPDLVTVCFGYNDWDAGMRGPMFLEAQREAVDRIRRATNGKADVLLMTPARALSRWTEMAELGEATRQAARETNAGLADLEAAFEQAGAAERARLFVHDKVHLSPAGQEVVASAVLAVLTQAAR